MVSEKKVVQGPTQRPSAERVKTVKDGHSKTSRRSRKCMICRAESSWLVRKRWSNVRPRDPVLKESKRSKMDTRKHQGGQENVVCVGKKVHGEKEPWSNVRPRDPVLKESKRSKMDTRKHQGGQENV